MRYFVLVFIFSICCISLHAQKRTTNYGNKYKPIRMTHKKAKVICPIFEKSAYPYHGFGFKVGDPVALTYKLYFRKYLSFVVDGGSSSSGLYTSKHRSDFKLYSSEINIPEDYPIDQSFYPVYTNHRVLGEYVAEGKVLFQMQTDQLYKGLQTYVGIGWQYRQLGIEYVYYYGYPNSNEIGKDTFQKNKTYQGPELILGIEYSYFQIPVSAFMEITAFRDITFTSWSRLQGGIGLRYVF